MTVAELIEKLKAMPQEMTVLVNTCEGPIPLTHEPKIEFGYHKGNRDAYYGWSIDYFAESAEEAIKAAAEYDYVSEKVVTL